MKDIPFRDDTYSFDRHLEQMKLLYEHAQDLNKKLRQRLSEYNKDVEIQKRQKEIDYLRKHALVIFSDQEAQDAEEFRKAHDEKHWHVDCSTFVYTLTSTGLGYIIKMTCPICGETKDITDTSTW